MLGIPFRFTTGKGLFRTSRAIIMGTLLLDAFVQILILNGTLPLNHFEMRG
jgi:hypothetical protein